MKQILILCCLLLLVASVHAQTELQPITAENLQQLELLMSVEQERAYNLYWSPDNQFLFVFLEQPYAMQVWRLSNTGLEPFPIGEDWEEKPTTVDFTDDSSIAVFGTWGGTVYIYSLAENRLLRTLNLEEALYPTDSIDISPDGRYIASSHMVHQYSGLYLRDSQTGDVIFQLDGGIAVFSPDGQYLIVYLYLGLHFWAMEDLLALESPTDFVLERFVLDALSNPLFISDDELTFMRGRTVRRWNIASQSLISDSSPIPCEPCSHRYKMLDENVLMFHDVDWQADIDRLYFWDFSSNEILYEMGFPFNPDESFTGIYDYILSPNALYLALGLRGKIEIYGIRP